jgi:hypothetical protein
LHDVWKVRGFQGMECVPALMQESLHIVVDAYGVHKNEWFVGEFKKCTICAVGFVLAAFEIEELFLHQSDPSERTQRRAAKRVNVFIPRTDRFDPHLLSAAFIDPAGSGHNHFLDGGVEDLAILGAVIEAGFLLPDISTVIGFACVCRDLLSQGEEFAPQLVDGGLVRQHTFAHQAPGIFSDGPVAFLNQDLLHFSESAFIVVPFHSLRPDDRVILVAEFLFLREKRKVGFAVLLRLGAHVTDRDFHPRGRQSAGEKLFLQLLVIWT